MWKPSLKQHILNTYSIDYYSNLIKHLLEHHVLYICQHHPDTLQEDIDDVGMEMDRLPIPSSPSLQGETQVDLKIEINNNVKINQRQLNKYHIIKIFCGQKAHKKNWKPCSDVKILSYLDRWEVKVVKEVLLFLGQWEPGLVK